jgi:acetyl-CoA C-acetyltransferase
MPETVIVATARSPIGRAGKGSLRDIRPENLTMQIVESVLKKVPQLDPSSIDDLLLGTANPAGETGRNFARVVAVAMGLDPVPGTTVNRFCASSVQTTRMAHHAIRAGEGDAFLSVGLEMVSASMRHASTATPDRDTKHPTLFEQGGARTSRRASGALGGWTDPRDSDEMPDIYISMGETAENVASAFGVSREEQDRFAVLSQNRAEAAAKDGFFTREITPIMLDDGTTITSDDGPRSGVTYEQVASLAPAFRAEGTVTAANCCPLNDGAAAVILMSDTRAKELGITPLARVISTGVSALSPEVMGMGPVEATRRALKLAGMSIKDIDIAEINEAFAAQVIPSYQQLGIDPDKLNVNGGAIALGHPFGMTGARILNTLLHTMEERDEEVGLETMCVAGGQGMALLVQRLS